MDDLQDPAAAAEHSKRENLPELDATEKWLASYFSDAFARARAGDDDAAGDLAALRDHLELMALEEVAEGGLSTDAAYVEVVETFYWTPPGSEREQYALEGELVPARRPIVLANPEKFRVTDRRPSDEPQTPSRW